MLLTSLGHAWGRVPGGCCQAAGPHPSREQAYSEMTGFFPKHLSVFCVCLLKQKNTLCINTPLQPFQKYWPGLCLSICRAPQLACGMDEPLSITFSVCPRHPSNLPWPQPAPHLPVWSECQSLLLFPTLALFCFLALSVRLDPSVVSAMV